MTDLNEVMASPLMRVKLVTFVHFLFVTNSMLGWANGQEAYLFYNFLFIISLFWTMHSKDSIEAAQSALVIDACSIFLDIISIILYIKLMNGWATAFTIINLIMRPLSVILLYKEYTYRGGPIIMASTVSPGLQQRSYQDIDVPTQTVPTNSSQHEPNIRSIF